MLWQHGEITAAGGAALLAALRDTFAADAGYEHLLLAMLAEAGSPLALACRRARAAVTLDSLRTALVAAARRRQATPAVHSAWEPQLLSAEVRAALEADRGPLAADQGESLLAALCLARSRPAVRNVFGNLGIDVERLLADLRAAAPSEALAIFTPEGRANPSAFSPSGRDVLRLIESEGRGLKLARISAALLFFALLSRPSGIAQRALLSQGATPKKLHEHLFLQLRSLSGPRETQLAVERESLQPSALAALESAAERARDLRLPRVGEAEIAAGLLAQNDLVLAAVLDAEKVDAAALARFCERFHSGEEAAAEASRRETPLAEIERDLRERIVGQDHAIDVLMPLLKRMRFNYAAPDRPLGVLLFLGPSGTGKTQLAKEIARAVYGSAEQMIYLEMGQFATRESKAIFVGAPPGYVGYGEGVLTNGLRDKPESVVLFDEVEKAHASVFDVLLRFLDEGRISDASGQVRDGRKCIVVLTSNKALDQLEQELEEQAELGALTRADRERSRQSIRAALARTEYFRPEFLNRVDELILFNRLDDACYERILRRLLSLEQQRLAREKQIQLAIDEASIVPLLVGQCRERAVEGARVCARLVSDLVLLPVIDHCLERPDGPPERLRVYVDGMGELRVADA